MHSCAGFLTTLFACACYNKVARYRTAIPNRFFNMVAYDITKLRIAERAAGIAHKVVVRRVVAVKTHCVIAASWREPQRSPFEESSRDTMDGCDTDIWVLDSYNLE